MSGAAVSSLLTKVATGRGGHDEGIRIVLTAVLVTVAVEIELTVAVIVGLALQYLPHAIAKSAASAESRGQTLILLSVYMAN